VPEKSPRWASRDWTITHARNCATDHGSALLRKLQYYDGSAICCSQSMITSCVRHNDRASKNVGCGVSPSAMESNLASSIARDATVLARQRGLGLAPMLRIRVGRTQQNMNASCVRSVGARRPYLGLVESNPALFSGGRIMIDSVEGLDKPPILDT